MSRMKRREEDDSFSRLVYSTGGEPAEPSRTRPASRPAPAGAPGPSRGGGLRLRLEKRPGNRVVTLLTGLSDGELARELKAACHTGGTFRDDILELQGDHRDRLEELLAARQLRSRRAG